LLAELDALNSASHEIASCGWEITTCSIDDKRALPRL
jgi:hypothetical protein